MSQPLMIEVVMWYGRYLLNLEQTKKTTPDSPGKGGEISDLEARMLPYLDKDRQKAIQGKKGEARWQSIGAGLLLQKAIQDFTEGCVPGDKWLENRWQAEDLLAELRKQTPLGFHIAYGAKGKPYFTDIPLKFNLSHSGRYVLCVACEEEVGADVQWQKPFGYDKLSNRFFSEEERTLLSQCWEEPNRRALFYKMWTAKEAYGKLTGEGLSTALENICYRDENILWEYYSFEEEGEDYSVGICRWK